MMELSEIEAQTVQGIEGFLNSRNPDEGALVRQRFGCLDNLAKAISGYPSVRESQMLRGVVRDEQKLLAALCSFGAASHLLHIPSRVVMARSFLVAKYQAFSLLHILVKETRDFEEPLKRIIFSVVFTLMTEEVYFSCLDDPGFSQEIKIRVADDLITLWDSGTDPRLVRHFPALEALWTARDSSPPAFGTMNGTSELLRITIDMEKDWQEFLIDQSTMDETRWALEEFLFGLSYEEISEVRSRLARFGIAAVNHDEVRTYLGSNPAYEPVSGSDSRAIYDFYVDRRDAANFRKRTSVPGPQRTLEEIYLKYRIARE
ncbi:hypothetical protein [Leadbettera azotonutricia]|uniref:Uncharacterized protein n=1 Tax=Leadbettera azotonutricia (strain ATCC BAA-888 / DSM 13862 / ZAS-9) TaxID=545695 RepID=F5Y8C5_LEAAZ|nr:hypothetical protein [Leadbettera azotonutricia]AEF81813.1 conserved hypothetical protein [Leadbettera azotonutricia ZAS-9]